MQLFIYLFRLTEAFQSSWRQSSLLRHHHSLHENEDHMVDQPVQGPRL